MHNLPPRSRGLVLNFLIALLVAVPRISHATDGFIGNAINTEDLNATPDGRWIVASSLKVGEHRGVLYAIDTRTKGIEQVYPNTAPKKSATTAGDKNCSNEVAAQEFAPHGINLHKNADQSLLLYVVNHGARESVEIFSVGLESQKRLSVVWNGCIPLPPGTMANSVAVGGDGTVFITAAGKLLETPKSDVPPPFPPSGVLAWNKQAGWRIIESGITGLSNGLVISPDSKFLYVADWLKKTITEVNLANPSKQRTAAVAFLPDNLRSGEQGTVWVAGQQTSVQAVFDCFTSTRPACGLDSGVALLDTHTMTVQCSQTLAPKPEFSSATVALPLNKDLWLGSFRGPSIAIKKLAASKSPDVCFEQ